MRRRDFLRGRPDQVPSLNSVALQIMSKLDDLHLSKVFIATEAPQKEFEELKQLKKYVISWRGNFDAF